MRVVTGLTATVELTVGDDDTAIAVGSGDVPVLATPRVVALVEEATVAAVTPVLDTGETTVGTRVEIDHLLPTPVGATVHAEARLVTVRRHRLRFAVEVREGTKLVARGTVTRAVVDRERFLDSLGG